jgi:hypothetical protein
LPQALLEIEDLLAQRRLLPRAFAWLERGHLSRWRLDGFGGAFGRSGQFSPWPPSARWEPR